MIESKLLHFIALLNQYNIIAITSVIIFLIGVYIIYAQRVRYARLYEQWRSDLEYKNRWPEQLERIASLEQEKQDLQQNKLHLISQNAELNTKLHYQQELNQKIESYESRLNDSFKSMAYQALNQNMESFLQIAKLNFDKTHAAVNQDLDHKHQSLQQVIQPLKDSLLQFDNKINELEKQRLNAYELLRHQIQDLNASQHNLRLEAAKLASALRSPNVRGRWGEIQLRRVVEIAGMLNYCDFVEQQTVINATDNKRYRPDMIIRLPGEKTIVIDAKTPLNSYIAANESEDEDVRSQHLQEHARQIKQHIQSLSARKYWEQFTDSPEFVILFLPGDSFFSAALTVDPTLIEVGAEQKVIIATPIILITLLRIIATSWNHQQIAQNFTAMSELGKNIVTQIQEMSEFLNKLGRNINSSTESYNSLLKCINQKLLPVAEKLDKLQNSNSTKALLKLNEVESVAKGA